MPTTDPTKLPKEITDKYSIVSNAFRHVKDKSVGLDSKGKPKDLITVEIGDTKVSDFMPQVKLCRWGDDEETNEVNFSVRLKDEDTINTATISTDKDKIVWEKGNIKIENYDFTEDEGGYKFVWYLKSKPLTNKVEFTIQSKGLDFFYQPELTAEEIAEGAFRPENVVGSYAVYHQTKGGMNDSADKEYKTGKAFHIYRPHIIDANGAETWGNLHIENVIYSVEIPQDFLDTAVYPIKSNDTFGYTTIGGSDLTASTDSLQGSYFLSPGNGTITSITYYQPVTSGFGKAAGLFLKDGGGAGIHSYMANSDQSTSNVVNWITLSITTGDATITASVDYMIAIWFEAHNIKYDTTYDYDNRYSETEAYPGSWTDFSDGTPDAGVYSIYATYTPAATGVVKDVIMGGGVIAFAR